MPIKGISEVRRLPRLGKIRLGVKETSQRTGSPYPRAVDYFVCNADQSTSEAAARAFREVYGDKPQALDIMFPVDDRDQFFAQFYRRYGSGTGLLCKGDGESAVEIDRETGEIKEIECNPILCEWAVKKHCRPVGTLQFLLVKVPGLGAWQIDTSSYHSIVNLNSAIDFIRSLTGGRIAMIPLKLIIRPQEVQVEGKKKIVYVLDLTHESVKLQDILLASQKTAAQLLLPSINLDEAPDDLFPPEILNENPPKNQEPGRGNNKSKTKNDTNTAAKTDQEGATMARNESAVEQVQVEETGERKTEKDPLIHMMVPPSRPQELPVQQEQPTKEQRQGAVPKDAYKLLAINTGRSSTGTPYAKVGCISPEGRTTILLAKGEKGLAMVADLKEGCYFKAQTVNENGFEIITALEVA